MYWQGTSVILADDMWTLQRCACPHHDAIDNEAILQASQDGLMASMPRPCAWHLGESPLEKREFLLEIFVSWQVNAMQSGQL